MADRKPSRAPRGVASAGMTTVHPDAAGIDVHSNLHVVCVPDGRDPDGQGVRSFGANTADLHTIADWLDRCGVRTIAMESTGVYWIPLFELLESRGLEVCLVEPGQLSHCGARPKTDVLDAQWIQRLHSYGLLRPSFRPPDSVLALRGYHRQRQMLIRSAAAHVQHMQKAMEQMNLKLTEVVSDILGLTGRRIIEAILAGERDPAKLATLRHERCHRDEREIALALEGTWRPEHLFALKQAYELYCFHHGQIGECDEQIAAELARLPDRSGGRTCGAKPRKRGRKRNDATFEATGPLFRALGVDLTEVDGIDVATALVILAEIGVDVSRFPTEKHFASWLGLCPRQDRSNETIRRRPPRRGKNRVAQALRMAAQAVGRTPTALGLFYRRIRSRIGPAGAITATAHKLSRLVYRMLKYGADYVRPDLAEYEARMRDAQERSLRRKATALGYTLVPLPSPSVG